MARGAFVCLCNRVHLNKGRNRSNDQPFIPFLMEWKQLITSPAPFCLCQHTQWPNIRRESPLDCRFAFNPFSMRNMSSVCHQMRLEQSGKKMFLFIFICFLRNKITKMQKLVFNNLVIWINLIIIIFKNAACEIYRPSGRINWWRWPSVFCYWQVAVEVGHTDWQVCVC